VSASGSSVALTVLLTRNSSAAICAMQRVGGNQIIDDSGRNQAYQM
jgi:hypothetical protein